MVALRLEKKDRILKSLTVSQIRMEYPLDSLIANARWQGQAREVFPAALDSLDSSIGFVRQWGLLSVNHPEVQGIVAMESGNKT